MKETTAIPVDPIAIHAQKEVAKKKVLFGKLHPHPGQSVFQLDLIKGVLGPAEIEEKNVAVKNGETKVLKSIKVKDGHLYCCALNRRNAMKQFTKMLNKYTKK